MAFSFAVIIVLGLGADYLFRRMKLPGLVGMLIAGVLVGPCVLTLISPDMMAVSSDFRTHLDCRYPGVYFSKRPPGF